MVTFLASLGLGMEYGILVGVGMSALIILFRSLHPAMTVEFGRDRKTGLKYLLLKPDQGIYYPSVDFIRDTVNLHASRYDNHKFIVLECDKWTRWDFTAANSIISLAKSLEKSGKVLILFKYHQTWTKAFDTLKASKPICCSNVKELCETLRHHRDSEPKPSDSLVTNVEDDEEDNEQSLALPR